MKEDNIKKQEKITDLTDDLLTVLESHMDILGRDELFFYTLNFVAKAMYDCIEDHKISREILAKAIDKAISDYVHKNKGKHPVNE